MDDPCAGEVNVAAKIQRPGGESGKSLQITVVDSLDKVRIDY